MAKIIVISDTHRNQKLLRIALQNEENYDYIFHLGDYYEDLDENLDLIENAEIVKVPGILHPGYEDNSLDKIKIITIDNWSFALVHNVLDAMMRRTLANFILHGHTHRTEFKEFRKSYLLNPGHLKYEFDRGREASYVTIVTDDKKVNIQWKDLVGKVFREENISEKL
ncbi:MAG: hypothetical protein HN952_08360 [Candidatus Cloacimonetes bacterium]|jgi:putative phosphoesterase|nr:hypothetical protein [Candidatus Cloacimonadota bacterium]MBT6994947.1 hypothetical protein [Candidatus Cloacimonadota bacterium]MBT7469522.1 hypothetical protein [Candidatus Cloacimonadota bacterium]